MNENKFWLEYRTGTNNIYPIEIGFKKISLDEIVYEPETIRNLCKVGCKNYNFAGGCPPRAPLFEELIKGVKSVFLVFGTFWPEYKTESVKKSSRIYVHFRLQDQILSRIFHKLGIKMRERQDALFLGSGFCMGCSGKKCNYKLGYDYCLNPSKRTYSMESTGINVCETLENAVDIKLFWYRKGQGLDIPLTKCCAFLFKGIVGNNDFSEMIFNACELDEYIKEGI